MRALLVATAAASVVSAVFSAKSHAQTWVNPTSGNWSFASNWVGGVAPSSGSSTDLVFNAAGSETYTASNDLTSPFLLNSITFDNSGTGLITLDLNAIAFGGANPSIVQSGSGSARINNALQLTANTSYAGSGSGTVTLAGLIASSPAATGTTGSSLVNSNPNGNLVLQGGLPSATLYGLRLSTGNTFVSAGTYTLSSTQRGSDPFESVNDGGFWGLIVGNTAGQTANFTMTGGGINAQNGFVGNVAGSNGIATFSGVGTSATFAAAQGRFGTNAGNGTINILNGAIVTARRGDLVRNTGGTGFMQVAGAGSKFSASQELNVPLSSGNATLNVANSGTVQLTNANFFLASAVDAAFNPVSSNASVTVSGSGSGITASGDGISTGAMLIGFGAAIVPANGTLSISSGGVVTMPGAFIGRAAGTGTVNVSGVGSQFNNTFQVSLGSTTASSINVAGGATWNNAGDTFTSTNGTDRAIIDVSGTNSIANLVGVLVLSDGGSSTLNINSGGELRTATLFAADGIGGQANVSVNGANSRLTLTNQLIAGDASASIASISVTGGANLNVSSAAFLSPTVDATSSVAISGAGSTYTSTGAATELHVGGNGIQPGGTASFSVSDGAIATVTGPAIVYPRGTLRVGAGALGGSFTSPSNTVNGTVQFEAGTFNTSGTLAVGGQILLASAARDALGTPSNKKVLEAGALVMTASAVIDLNDNDAIFKSTSLATVQGRITAARNGGAWNAAGITSTAAKNASPANTTLAAITGAEFHTAQGPAATFDGRNIANGDVLVKYTYYGDTDLNGVVNFDDYARADSGFNNNRSGWFNGDFDYNGIVNFDDYSLIDLAFNSQGSAVLSTGGNLAGPAGDRAMIDAPMPNELSRPGIAPARVDPNLRHGYLNAVPEPSALVAASLTLFAASTRRRHRRDR